MEPDMEKILSLLDSYGGTLPFTEKADPEIIRRETGMSKNEFKRAVGHLYKLRKISLEGGIIKSC
jgi:predicted RNA-binding protein (virulence factor B family)